MQTEETGELDGDDDHIEVSLGMGSRLLFMSMSA